MLFDLISYGSLILAALWILLNLFWFVILFIKKRTKIKLPQELEFHVRKTIRINFIYLVIFSLLGYLFL